MKELIDNEEMQRVLSRLEELEDENLAVDLLKEFNDATKDFGQLLLNKDEKIDHKDWKEQCDKAQARVEAIIAKINKT